MTIKLTNFKKFFYPIFPGLFLVLGYFILRAECLKSETAGISCLSDAEPLFSTIVAFGINTLRDPSYWYVITTSVSISFVLLIFIITLIKSKNNKIQISLYLFAIIIGILADFASSRLFPSGVILGYSLVAILALIFFFSCVFQFF